MLNVPNAYLLFEVTDTTSDATVAVIPSTFPSIGIKPIIDIGGEARIGVRTRVPYGPRTTTLNYSTKRGTG